MAIHRITSKINFWTFDTTTKLEMIHNSSTIKTLVPEPRQDKTQQAGTETTACLAAINSSKHKRGWGQLQASGSIAQARGWRLAQEAAVDVLHLVRLDVEGNYLPFGSLRGNVNLTQLHRGLRSLLMQHLWGTFQVSLDRIVFIS